MQGGWKKSAKKLSGYTRLSDRWEYDAVVLYCNIFSAINTSDGNSCQVDIDLRNGLE